MSAATRLVDAMRAARCDFRSASQWLEAAQHSDALLAALHAVFGRNPHHIKLGKWLHAHCGPYGEVALVRVYSGHRKAWTYGVETPAESAAREHEERQAQERRITLEAEKEQRAIRRALRAADEKVAEERALAEAQAPADSLKIQVVQEPAVKPFKCGPDGKPEPVEELPLPGDTPKETPPPVMPTVSVAPAADSRYPVWVRERRQPTRQELAAAHEQQPNAPRSYAHPALGYYNLDPWQSNGVRTAPSEELIGPWGNGWQRGADWSKRL